MENTFKSEDKEFTRLWHCFGNSYHMAPLNTVIDMINASKTNVLPVNTHNLVPQNKNGLELGYAGVPLSMLQNACDVSKMHIMLNINLQTSAEAAINKTKLAFDMSGEKLIKLEVLDKEHKHSNQDEIVKAASELNKWNHSLKVYPLFANDLTTAKRLVDAGCKLLRVMGSAIGACKGITDQDTFQKICALGVPVVLDGGVGSLDHAKNAISLGAQGVLVNSMLFEQDRPPSEVLEDFAAYFNNAV